MATITNITTGEQSITTTGAVTGTLDTSALTGDLTVHVRVRSLGAGKTLRVALEDTAHATPFSEAQTVWVWDFTGSPDEGTVKSIRLYQLGDAIRWGATNNKLRLNVSELTAGGTAKLYGWIGQ